jgi:hypothetical protein
MTTTDAPIPDLAILNRAELWLAYFRHLQDGGLPIAEARRRADEQFGPGRS